MIEDVIGRARVQSTPELEEYYARLAKHGSGALWTVANEIEPWFPQPRSIPMLWRYDELRPLVVESAILVTGDNAGRRVVYLVNDERRDVSAAVGLLYSGLQIMNPGESMTAHRHAAAALRFVIEGDESTRHGYAEKVEWPDGATFTIRELPSGRLLENGTAVRVLGVDPLDYFRIKESALCFVGGLPAPRADDGSRWLREQLARER